MALDINVTVSLAPADRGLFKDFIEVIKSQHAPAQSDKTSPESDSGAVVEQPRPARQEAETRHETEPETKVENVELPFFGNADDLLSEIRDVIRSHTKSHRDKIKALMAEYNVRKSAELPTEKLPEFLEALKTVVAA